jgi:putative membrane protein
MKTRKWIFALMLAPLVWIGCNDDDDNGSKKSLNSTDEAFVENAARGNKAEIDMGNIAVTKASDSLVRNFAQKMIDEHTMAQNELQDISDDFAGVNWPDDLDQTQASMKAQLDSTSAGYSFDTLYLNTQIKLHQSAVSTFQTATTSTTESRVKSYATKYLPKIQAHLNEVDSLQTQVTTNGSTANDSTSVE